MNKVDQEQKTPSLLQVTGSVLASFFGVQSSRRREQDFTQGRPAAYILIGLVATLIFVLGLWGVVQLVVSLGLSPGR